MSYYYEEDRDCDDWDM